MRSDRLQQRALGQRAHLLTFDIVYRYLQHLGFKVRYVENITDVGHLTGDTDDGEDKIGKKARLENLEPWKWCRNTPTTFTT